MSWMLIIAVGWVLISAVVGVLIGLTIRAADRRDEQFTQASPAPDDQRHILAVPRSVGPRHLLRRRGQSPAPPSDDRPPKGSRPG
jgi:hypothetical protein